MNEKLSDLKQPGGKKDSLKMKFKKANMLIKQVSMFKAHTNESEMDKALNKQKKMILGNIRELRRSAEELTDLADSYQKAYSTKELLEKYKYTRKNSMSSPKNGGESAPEIYEPLEKDYIRAILKDQNNFYESKRFEDDKIIRKKINSRPQSFNVDLNSTSRRLDTAPSSSQKKTRKEWLSGALLSTSLNTGFNKSNESITRKVPFQYKEKPAEVAAPVVNKKKERVDSVFVEMNLMAHLRKKMVSEIVKTSSDKQDEKYNNIRELKEKFIKTQKEVLLGYEFEAEKKKKRREMLSRSSLKNTIYQLLAMGKEQRIHTKKKLSELMPPISRFTSNHI